MPYPLLFPPPHLSRLPFLSFPFYSLPSVSLHVVSLLTYTHTHTHTCSTVEEKLKKYMKPGIIFLPWSFIRFYKVRQAVGLSVRLSILLTQKGSRKVFSLLGSCYLLGPLNCPHALYLRLELPESARQVPPVPSYASEKPSMGGKAQFAIIEGVRLMFSSFCLGRDCRRVWEALRGGGGGCGGGRSGSLFGGWDGVVGEGAKVDVVRNKETRTKGGGTARCVCCGEGGHVVSTNQRTFEPWDRSAHWPLPAPTQVPTIASTLPPPLPYSSSSFCCLARNVD